MLLAFVLSHRSAGEAGSTPGASPGTSTGRAAAPAPDDAHPGPAEPDVFPTPPPPFSDGIFPCSECHADQPVNPEPRKLVDMHEDIALEHGPRRRWCFDCHNPPDRDKLRLADGTLVEMTQSYLLCGQCHGTQFRDWRFGVHGKRTGQWDGEKQYLLCAHCHNPHKPRFAALQPLPPPVPPSEIK
jgi:hypothetical protein